MALNQLSIYLTKSLKINVDANPTKKGCSHECMGAVVKNLQNLGFGLSPELIESLLGTSDDYVQKLYEKSLPLLKKMVGAHRNWEPMYPNFPQQVAEASEAELWINAMIHYAGFVISDMIGDPTFVMLPEYEKKERPTLDEYNELRWIKLGDEDDFNSIFTRLAGANTSISESDKEILSWFAKNRDVSHLMPGQIPQKETLSYLIGCLEDRSLLVPAIKTATDVLRVACVLSDGDVSLATPTKFSNFSRKDRRFLMECLENCGDSRTEDMLRWKERWIRLGERLHPGEYKRFSQANESFDILRNKKPFETFNSKAEKLIAQRDAEATTALLSERPGDFSRRLDHVLRTHEDADVVLKEYLKKAEKVSTPVLLQLWKHFSVRNEIAERAFFPKGNVSKIQLGPAPAPLDEKIARKAARGIRKVLVKRFSKMEPLGKVLLEDELQSQIVPFSQRSASRSLRAVVRGSRFDLPDYKNTIRFFIWWKNISKDEYNGRVDLDLSASMFDENWNSTGQVAYYNLRESKAYHSGDVTSAPKGACEFIDIDLPNVVENGSRYIVMSVISFTGQNFSELPECFGGWMLREGPNSGEVFEPKTVQEKVDVVSPNTVVVPVIVDAVDRKVIWGDIGLNGRGGLSNAYSNNTGISAIGRAMCNMKKPTLHDLFSMHVEARGELVSDSLEADIKFGLFDGSVTAFDTDLITSEYLA